MLKIISVQSPPEWILSVKFNDGRSGSFDVKPFMTSDYFCALKNQNYFDKVDLFFSGVGWPDGQDFSADTIAAHLCETENKVIARL